MSDTEGDLAMKATLVKLTGNNEEDVEIAWGTVPVNDISAAYAVPNNTKPKSFPIELNNADGADGVLKINLRFTTELLEG